MKTNEFFKNVFTYAAGLEAWAKKQANFNYTFVYDFASADWCSGVEGVKKTYIEVRKHWRHNYEAFTEVAMSLNMLAWANAQLQRQGIEDRQEYVKLYSEMYYQARDDFYDTFEGDETACRYFFEMTD